MYRRDYQVLKKSYRLSKKLRINRIERIFYKIVWKVYMNRDLILPCLIILLVIGLYLLANYAESVTP